MNIDEIKRSNFTNELSFIKANVNYWQKRYVENRIEFEGIKRKWLDWRNIYKRGMFDELKISPGRKEALINNGIDNVLKLILATDSLILKIPGFGQAGLEQIDKALRLKCMVRYKSYMIKLNDLGFEEDMR